MPKPMVIQNGKPSEIQLLNALKYTRRQIKSGCKRGSDRPLQPEETATLKQQIETLLQQREVLYKKVKQGQHVSDTTMENQASLPGLQEASTNGLKTCSAKLMQQDTKSKCC